VWWLLSLSLSLSLSIRSGSTNGGNPHSHTYEGNPHSHTYESKSHAQRKHPLFFSECDYRNVAIVSEHQHASLARSRLRSTARGSPDIWNSRWLDEGNPRSHTYEGNPHSHMCASNLHTWIALACALVTRATLAKSGARSLSLSLHICNIHAPDRSIWQRDRVPAQAQGTFSDVVVLEPQRNGLEAPRPECHHGALLDDTRDLHRAKGVSLTCDHVGVAHREMEACL